MADETSKEKTNKKLSGVTLMQAMGHQVVGSDCESHEEVKLMYEKFFGGQAVIVRRVLRKDLGSIQARRMLSKIFQVMYEDVKATLVGHLLKSSENGDSQRMTIESRKEKQEAIESLFEVTDLFTSGGDADKQADMQEKKDAYGIVLQRSGLMGKDAIEKQIADTKHKFDETSKFSAVEHFPRAKSLAGELLDAYITGGIRLAWMMVTRIPPMIAVEPTAFEEHSTISEDFNDNDISLEPNISLRPILYFSYEGEVAVQGIISNPPSNFVSRDTGSADCSKQQHPQADDNDNDPNNNPSNPTITEKETSTTPITSGNQVSTEPPVSHNGNETTDKEKSTNLPISRNQAPAEVLSEQQQQQEDDSGDEMADKESLNNKPDNSDLETPVTGEPPVSHNGNETTDKEKSTNLPISRNQAPAEVLSEQQQHHDSGDELADKGDLNDNPDNPSPSKQSRFGCRLL